MQHVIDHGLDARGEAGALAGLLHRPAEVREHALVPQRPGLLRQLGEVHAPFLQQGVIRPQQHRGLLAKHQRVVQAAQAGGDLVVTPEREQVARRRWVSA